MSVISGVPGEKFKIKTDEVKEGAVCVNLSTEKVRSSEQLPASMG